MTPLALVMLMGSALIEKLWEEWILTAVPDLTGQILRFGLHLVFNALLVWGTVEIMRRIEKTPPEVVADPRPVAVAPESSN